MTYPITLTDKEAADIMLAMGRMPVDQIGESYVSVRNQLIAAGYDPQKLFPSSPPIPAVATAQPPVVDPPTPAHVLARTSDPVKQ